MMTEQTWNDVVRKYAVVSGTFMHSWAWGEFQQSQGREVKRILVGGEETVTTLIAQAVKLDAPLGIRYWLVPKGPLGDVSSEFMRGTLVNELVGVDYIRTESETRLPKTISAKEMHPKTTRLLDLTKGYDAVAEDFSTRVRYNTRLAAKKGVICEFVGLDRFDEFVELMKQTAERDAFSLHEMKYYRAMLESLQGAQECSAKLAIASKDGTPLAATLTIDSFGTRTYLHGASGNQMRELKATHALQDFVIHDACDSGMSSYDFWGIAPEGAPKSHPWAGITEFKKAFGGYIVSSPGTFDIPLNPLKYGMYRVARFAKGLIGR
jgi:lipid II:glycine glycyltransferase (peptidoglycan interpeptide bridge formation enzyme)